MKVINVMKSRFMLVSEFSFDLNSFKIFFYYGEPPWSLSFILCLPKHKPDTVENQVQALATSTTDDDDDELYSCVNVFN